MAETHLDHPGEITWFAGHGPAAVLGDCPHTCTHSHTQVIAWGPDFDHYTLVACVDACQGRCRAWTQEWPPEGPQNRLGMPRYRLGKFRLVDRELSEPEVPGARTSA